MDRALKSRLLFTETLPAVLLKIHPVGAVSMNDFDLPAVFAKSPALDSESIMSFIKVNSGFIALAALSAEIFKLIEAGVTMIPASVTVAVKKDTRNKKKNLQKDF